VKRDVPRTTRRGPGLAAAALRGAASGLVGVSAMTAAEKVEQLFTGRANSYVPGRTMRALMGADSADRQRPLMANHAMHWSTGALLGALRGVWAVTGLRGPGATIAHTVVRLAVDQTLENATGLGAPPSTWPRSERLLDVAHKSIYSWVTGAVADRWISPELETHRGPSSH
jgi:hypothetical protein